MPRRSHPLSALSASGRDSPPSHHAGERSDTEPPGTATSHHLAPSAHVYSWTVSLRLLWLVLMRTLFELKTGNDIDIVLSGTSLLNDSDYVSQAKSLVDEDSPNAYKTEPPIDAKEDHNARMTVSDIKEEDDSRVDELEPQSDAKEDDSRIVGVESRTDAHDDDIARMAGLESQSDTNKDDRTETVDLESQSKAKETDIVDVDVVAADDTSCKALQDPHGTAPSIWVIAIIDSLPIAC